jgi:hypothetical protein
MATIEAILAKYRGESFSYEGRIYYEESLVLKILSEYEKPKSPSKVLTIEERASAFAQTIVPYIEKYGKVMCREFYDYWTEKSQTGTKMRFELEKAWDISKRLSRWKSKAFVKVEKEIETPKRKFKQL